jgi:hypothetical protein
MPTLRLEGGCLCRRTRYSVETESDEGYYCHCRMCQLAFGNTRAAFFNVRKDALRWVGEAPSRYASSRIAVRGFCSQCGTPLSFDYPEGERIDLSVGSLDQPDLLRPTSHFAVESRIARWHVDDGLPEQRLDEYPSLVQRWRKAYGDDVEPGLDAASR